MGCPGILVVWFDYALLKERGREREGRRQGEREKEKEKEKERERERGPKAAVVEVVSFRFPDPTPKKEERSTIYSNSCWAAAKNNYFLLWISYLRKLDTRNKHVYKNFNNGMIARSRNF
jgi:hypothetical protein